MIVEFLYILIVEFTEMKVFPWSTVLLSFFFNKIFGNKMCQFWFKLLENKGVWTLNSGGSLIFFYQWIVGDSSFLHQWAFSSLISRTMNRSDDWKTALTSLKSDYHEISSSQVERLLVVVTQVRYLWVLVLMTSPVVMQTIKCRTKL